MEIDLHDQNPPKSIIQLSKSLLMSMHPNQIQKDGFHPTIPIQDISEQWHSEKAKTVSSEAYTAT